jgi:hypothetical protein
MPMPSRFIVAAVLIAAPPMAVAQTRPSACPPDGYTRAALTDLKSREWAIADDAARNRFARNLTACLASPDPELRDGVAFEALQHLLRTRQLSEDTMLALQDDLEARLQAPEGPGFERPFAALALAEVARTDRIQAYLTTARRERLVTAATTFLRGVRDYRGFDDREGWRHGVAHGADLMLQLSLNQAIDKAQLDRIRDAIASQVAPVTHAYVFGESLRLAAPIAYIAQRNVFSEAEWAAWFARVASPAPLDSWEGTFSSEAKLRKRHNLIVFLTTVALEARASTTIADDVLIAPAEKALREVPQ